VAGERSAVPPPEDDVGVDPRGAVLPRHVPGHRRDLDRLVDGDVLVGPGVPIEERDHGLAEGADRAEARGRQILLLGERGERADHLVTDIEDEREHALAPVPQQLRPHRTALLPQVAPQATMLMVIGKPVCGMAYTATPLTRATRRMRARRRPEAPTLSRMDEILPLDERLPMEEALTPELMELEREVTRCRRCPRLVEWRERVAREKRRAFAGEEYWGRPVPGWGDPEARLLVVGLAPAAHGANRTGRMFTGDESGRWLYRSLWRAGFASQPDAVRKGDGLEIVDCFVSAAVRCAPPGNRPTPAERENCRPWLEAEIDRLPRLAVVVALGGFAYDHVLRISRGRGHPVPTPKPAFGHGVEVPLGPGAPVLLASYHPSQQNTFTGVLTEAAFDRVFARAREILEA
jgi:uracil-DNA glycosylase family 4